MSLVEITTESNGGRPSGMPPSSRRMFNFSGRSHKTNRANSPTSTPTHINNGAPTTTKEALSTSFTSKMGSFTNKKECETIKDLRKALESAETDIPLIDLKSYSRGKIIGQGGFSRVYKCRVG